MIKIVFCLRRRSDLSREEFQTYWRSTHAPLVRSHADALGIRRYVQVHSVDDLISAAVAGPRHPPNRSTGSPRSMWSSTARHSDRPAATFGE